MKNKFLIISILLVFILIILSQTNVFAMNHTLEEVAESFNNSSTVKSYQDFGIKMQAYTDETEPNVLSISLTISENTTIVNYELEGDILSYEHLTDDNILTAYFLADTIGQVNGYAYGEVLNNFNIFTEEISDYTIEKEGFEINENNSYYSVKMNINKKVPLIDESTVYLKPSDLDTIKDIIDRNTVGNQSGKKSKLAYDVSFGNDESTICIGEKQENTESTYKSILSAIEVMYGKEVAGYFETEYPEFEEGIAYHDGFTVECDVQIDTDEYPIFSDTKVVLVTIDNEYMKDVYLRTEFIGEEVDRGNKTITLDFTTNSSYKISLFSSVKSDDNAFFVKYILTPVVSESSVELADDEDTIYFNIVDGKIVVGDKNNSIFKAVVREEYIELIPTITDVKKTTATLEYKKTEAVEYDECNYSNHYHFRYGIYNVTANVVYGKAADNEETTKTIVYQVLEGANQIYTLGKEGATFRINADYSLFVNGGKVYVDDKLVSSDYYTSKSGSTIITFTNEYMSSLSEGEHTLKVAFNNNGIATTKFTVAEASTTTRGQEAKVATKNPKTGDNIIMTMSIFVVAILGVYITLKINKKSKMRKH